jgi:predicted amidohydrolase YtcJ
MGNRVRLGGMKFFADGALGSRTALMLEPYRGFPGETGVAVDPPELVLERGQEALALGFSPVVHAIGDRANREVLSVLEALGPLAAERGMRLRLEHAQHLHPDDVARFGRQGVVASVQPVHIEGDASAAERLLGPERAAWSYAFRSLVEGGTTLALGSDAPVATPDPVAGFAAAVERRAEDGTPWHPEQALRPLEALAGYTRGAAAAAGWEGWYGRIAPGCAAEFTLWDGDPAAGLARPLAALAPGRET